jgi:Pyridoxamine 5'-phosphate oxidase
MTMGEPVAELDERFSDPGAKTTPWAKAREVLETAQLSWVTTVRADGRPHVTPLVAVWLDDAVHFTHPPFSPSWQSIRRSPPFRLKQLGRRGWANQRVVLKLEGSSPLDYPTPHPDAVPRSCPAPPSR